MRYCRRVTTDGKTTRDDSMMSGTPTNSFDTPQRPAYYSPLVLRKVCTAPSGLEAERFGYLGP